MSMSHRGTVRDELTLNVDLTETILGAAGLTPTAGMQGQDMADLYLYNANDWREKFYYEHPKHLAENAIPQSFANVRKNIKYITWDKLREESLYDLAIDANELHNVIDDPAYATVLSEFKQRYQEPKQKVKEPYSPSNRHQGNWMCEVKGFYGPHPMLSFHCHARTLRHTTLRVGRIVEAVVFFLFTAI
jgi:arylsulfatase A-like enzyme